MTSESDELKETRQRLAAAKEQLRLQSRRARQLVAACAAKVAEKEREMHLLRVLKDQQLQHVVRQLLRFESRLRQEQQRVHDHLRANDQLIQQQQRELQRLHARHVSPTHTHTTHVHLSLA